MIYKKPFIRSLFKAFVSLPVVVISINCCFAQTQYKPPSDSPAIELRWKPYINLDDYLKPFWKTDTIFDEILLVIRDGENTGVGHLLFDADAILSVRSADLKQQFEPGVDFTYEDNNLVRTGASRIPFLWRDSLIYRQSKPGWSMEGKVPGTFILFSESTFFRSKQLSVTYTRKKSSYWVGPVPKFVQDDLPNTIRRLRKAKPIKLVFFGNSIATGANSSDFQHQSPYMPSWPELVAYGLRKTYSGTVNFSNKSVGGKTSAWGRDNVSNAVLPENPDLVVIAFGMNDGTFNIPPGEFMQNIREIMDTVARKNKDAEFILVAPMLANPQAIQSQIQASYKPVLEALMRKGVVVADLTGVTEELLKFKNYQDITGNNVNHPNDYLARWYAQVILSFLINH